MDQDGKLGGTIVGAYTVDHTLTHCMCMPSALVDTGFIADHGIKLIDLVLLKKHVTIADYTVALTSVLPLIAQNKRCPVFNEMTSYE